MAGHCANSRIGSEMRWDDLLLEAVQLRVVDLDLANDAQVTGSTEYDAQLHVKVPAGHLLTATQEFSHDFPQKLWLFDCKL